MRSLLLTAVAVALLAHASSGSDKKNPAAVPLKRDTNRQKGFANKKDVEVVFLGDSITEGWERLGAASWNKFFVPLKAVNFGIRGDQTGHILWRLTEGKELDVIKPRVVVLLIGTNNISAGHSADDIAAAVGHIVKTIRDKSAMSKILLLGVLPREASPDHARRKKVTDINTRLARLDDEGKTVRYLDIGEKFLQKDGTLTKDIMPDYMHLTTKGYDIFAEAIKKPLEDLLK